MHRKRILFSLWFLTTLLLVLRILHISIVFGNDLRLRADANRFFRKYFLPPRGVIFDRNRIPLVQNAVLYAKVVGDPFVLHPRITPIDEHEALKLLITDPELVEKIPERFYPFGPKLSHVLGFVGFASGDEAIKYFNDKVGKDGLERIFEKELTGSRGIEEYEMNARGRLERLVNTQDPTLGSDISVTVDSALNVQASELLGSHLGAVVISDVEKGQVLALASSPSYDPMDIAVSLSDSQKPLLNRALQSYPPGSVFKMITALAALKNGSIKSDTLVHDEGELKVGEAIFRNWYFSSYGKTEGDINIVRALSRSNDVFFYKVSQLVGPEAIADMATLFHLGRKTGIELPGEKNGLIPTPSWKEKTLGEKWYLGDTYHMGIGQGDVLVTPVQINAMTAAIARHGIYCNLSLLPKRVPCEDLNLLKADVEIVISGMRDACSLGGTAFPFFTHNESVPEEQKVACKTGTAEHGAKDEHGNRQTHAWFTMFYPLVNPKIAITVLLESSGETKFLEGSADAAPIAKSLWEFWLSRNQ